MELMPCHYCKETGIDWASHFEIPSSFAFKCETCGFQCPDCLVEQEEDEDFEDYQRRRWGEAAEMWNELQAKLARLELLEAMLKSDEPEQTKGRL